MSVVREADDLPAAKGILTEVPLIGTWGILIDHRTSLSFPTPLTLIPGGDQGFFIRQFQYAKIVVPGFAMDFILEFLSVVRFWAAPLLICGTVSDGGVSSKDGFDEFDIFTQNCLCFGTYKGEERLCIG